jgi:hypothetical protein
MGASRRNSLARKERCQGQHGSITKGTARRQQNFIERPVHLIIKGDQKSAMLMYASVHTNLRLPLREREGRKEGLPLTRFTAAGVRVYMGGILDKVYGRTSSLTGKKRDIFRSQARLNKGLDILWFLQVFEHVGHVTTSTALLRLHLQALLVRP